MENLNLVKILENCPVGTELYSPVYGTVYFKEIDEAGKWRNMPDNRVICCTPENVADFPQGFVHIFQIDGKTTPQSECMLFPAKDQRDWSKFKAPLLVKEYKPCQCYWYKVTGDKEKDAALLDKLKDLMPDTTYLYQPSDIEGEKGRIVYNNVNHIEVINDVDMTFSTIVKMLGVELKIRQ